MRTLFATLGLAITVVLGLVPSAADAQRGMREVRPQPRLELAPFVGWQWGGGLTTSVGELKLKAEMNYGGTLGIRTTPWQIVEITYDYQGTSLVKETFIGDSTLFDVAVHYIQVGGRAERQYGRVVPFGVGGLGVGIFDPEGQRDSETRFSIFFGGGFIGPTDSRVAFRAQLRGWLTFLNTTGGAFCGGGGCAFSVSGNGIFQGDVSGGLVFRF